RIAEILGAKSAKVDCKLFGDGDSYIKFPTRKLDEEDVVIVQTTFPSQDKRILELLFMVKTAREFGARSVTAVVPYLSYARQDKRFDSEGRDIISIKAVLELLEAAGLSSLLTVDIHSGEALKYCGRIRAQSLDASAPIADYLLGQGLGAKENESDVLVIAPDYNASTRAKSVAGILKASFAAIEKHRDRETGEVSLNFAELDSALSKGRFKSAVVVDDMIFGGSTAIPVVEHLRLNNVEKIVVACVHGGFLGDSLERLRAAGATEIVATDTIPNPAARIGVAQIIAESLGKLLG
ncbi:MAG: ribose-phosphate pyrophosphokinase, partial [Candidatus Micrarchaeota archaeon]|nr:ribose-phosphate pyrophosphokinase [Candidatus Micrarchaeota archaeon]